MKKYKYIVLSDLDGTLLNSNEELSEATIKYVHKLNEKNSDVLFAFSTGRPWPQCKKIYEKLQLTGFVSCCNAALMLNPHTKQNIYAYINKTNVIKFLTSQLMMDHLESGFIYTDKVSLSFTGSTSLDVVKTLTATVTDVFCLKLFYNEKSHNIDQKIQFLKNFEPSPTTTIYHLDGMINIEVQASHVNKATAVNFFSDYYGVAKQNILVFGDSYNDLSVFDSEARSYAVKNAIYQIKQSAKICSIFSNDDDCVIKETELFLESKK